MPYNFVDDSAVSRAKETLRLYEQIAAVRNKIHIPYSVTKMRDEMWDMFSDFPGEQHVSALPNVARFQSAYILASPEGELDDRCRQAWASLRAHAERSYKLGHALADYAAVNGPLYAGGKQLQVNDLYDPDRVIEAHTTLGNAKLGSDKPHPAAVATLEKFVELAEEGEGAFAAIEELAEELAPLALTYSSPLTKMVNAI